MKLVVGLGNPGREYRDTRHNVGFWVLDRLEPDGARWSTKYSGLAADVMASTEKLVLLKPTTYMNRSGTAVRQAVDFYKLDASKDVLVVCDDLNLPLGRLRLRAKGSAGGQNGLKDIFAHLGGDAVARLRVGIGDRGRRDASDFVLSGFSPAEREEIDEATAFAAEAVKVWADDGLEVAMNQFNGEP